MKKERTAGYRLFVSICWLLWTAVAWIILIYSYDRDYNTGMIIGTAMNIPSAWWGLYGVLKSRRR